jgi:hypothetical protein
LFKQFVPKLIMIIIIENYTECFGVSTRQIQKVPLIL